MNVNVCSYFSGDSGGTYRAWQVGGCTNHPEYQVSGCHRMLPGAERRNLPAGTDSWTYRYGYNQPSYFNLIFVYLI